MITTQCNQQEILVHAISILNVTRYATKVNRQHTNTVKNAAEKMPQDVTTLYNITYSLYTSLSYQQIVLDMWSILANLSDSLYYMRKVTIHTMEYIDAETTAITLTTCTTYRRSQRNAITHWRNTSFHHAPTKFIRRYTPFLQISMYRHLDWRWTIPITDWGTNTGSCTKTGNVWSV